MHAKKPKSRAVRIHMHMNDLSSSIVTPGCKLHMHACDMYAHAYTPQAEGQYIQVGKKNWQKNNANARKMLWNCPYWKIKDTQNFGHWAENM